jgi:hypothetical protein
MFYKMIRFPQVSEIVESREIPAGKACKNWMAINIDSSVRFEVVYQFHVSPSVRLAPLDKANFLVLHWGGATAMPPNAH